MSHALFPYVLMQRDARGRTPIATLSDGLDLTLVHVTTEGRSKVMFREDLAADGIDAGAAYLDSRERLTRLVRARLVRMRAALGPSDVRCLAFQHSFLAASCAVLPDLFEIARRQLKADSMVLAIPQRHLLVVAPNLGASFRAELKTMLRMETNHVFSLEPSGPAWMPGVTPKIGPANFSSDGLRPYRQTSLVTNRKRCA